MLSTFVSTDTPKIIKATLTEGGETFTAIATVGIIKQGVAGSCRYKNNYRSQYILM